MWRQARAAGLTDAKDDPPLPLVVGGAARDRVPRLERPVHVGHDIDTVASIDLSVDLDRRVNLRIDSLSAMLGKAAARITRFESRGFRKKECRGIFIDRR